MNMTGKCLEWFIQRKSIGQVTTNLPAIAVVCMQESGYRQSPPNGICQASRLLSKDDN